MLEQLGFAAALLSSFSRVLGFKLHVEVGQSLWCLGFGQEAERSLKGKRAVVLENQF